MTPNEKQIQNLLRQFDEIVSRVDTGHEKKLSDLQEDVIMNMHQTFTNTTTVFNQLALKYADHHAIKAAALLLAAAGYTLFDLFNRHQKIIIDRNFTDDQLADFVKALSFSDVEHLATNLAVQFYIAATLDK